MHYDETKNLNAKIGSFLTQLKQASDSVHDPDDLVTPALRTRAWRLIKEAEHLIERSEDTEDEDPEFGLSIPSMGGVADRDFGFGSTEVDALKEDVSLFEIFDALLIINHRLGELMIKLKEVAD